MADSLFSQVVRFLFAGGVAALVNLFAGAMMRRLGAAYGASIIGGFVIGTLASFVLNRNFTFRAHAGRQGTQFAKFTLIALVGIAVAYIVGLIAKSGLVLAGMAPSGKTTEDVAHIITIGIMTLYNFLLMKYFAFTGAGGQGAGKVV